MWKPGNSRVLGKILGVAGTFRGSCGQPETMKGSLSNWCQGDDAVAVSASQRADHRAWSGGSLAYSLARCDVAKGREGELLVMVWGDPPLPHVPPAEPAFRRTVDRTSGPG